MVGRIKYGSINVSSNENIGEKNWLKIDSNKFWNYNRSTQRQLKGVILLELTPEMHHLVLGCRQQNSNNQDKPKTIDLLIFNQLDFTTNEQRY